MAKHKPLTLNQHDKIRASLKNARNEVEKVKRKVARRSECDDPTLQKLEHFWYLFEDVCWELSKRQEREHSKKELLSHYLRTAADSA